MVTDDYDTAVAELQKLMTPANAETAVNMINLSRHIPDVSVASSSSDIDKNAQVTYSDGKWLVESIYIKLDYQVTLNIYVLTSPVIFKCPGEAESKFTAAHFWREKGTHSASISASSPDGTVQNEWYAGARADWQQVIRNGVNLQDKGGE
jgi:hypothetical protein